MIRVEMVKMPFKRPHLDIELMEPPVPPRNAVGRCFLDLSSLRKRLITRHHPVDVPDIPATMCIVVPDATKTEASATRFKCLKLIDSLVERCEIKIVPSRDPVGQVEVMTSMHCHPTVRGL